MWTPVKLKDGSRAIGPAGPYGFGWFLDKFRGHRVVFHGGSTGTCIFRLPDDGLTVIVLTNLEMLAEGRRSAAARRPAPPPVRGTTSPRGRSRTPSAPRPSRPPCLRPAPLARGAPPPSLPPSPL